MASVRGMYPGQNAFTACWSSCASGAVGDSPERHSVVGRLLEDDSPGVRLLGTQLLRDLVTAQTTAELLRPLDTFVPGLCSEANPRVPFSGREHAAESTLRTLRAGAWSALLAHAALASRLGAPSAHRRALTLTALDALETALEEGEEDDAGAALGTLASLLALSSGSGPASTEQAAALEFLDRRRRWVGGAPVREAVLGALQEACPDSQFPQYTLLSRLIRHLATAELGSEEREAVVEVLAQRSAALGPGPAQVLLTQALGLAWRPGAPAVLAQSLEAWLLPALAPRLASRAAALEALADALEESTPGAQPWALAHRFLGRGGFPPGSDGRAPTALLSAWAHAARSAPDGAAPALGFLLAALEGCSLSACQGELLARCLESQAWWEEATPQTLCLLGELVQALPATVGAPLVATLVRDRVWGPGTAAAEEGEGNWGVPSASTPSFSPLNPAQACGVLLVCEAALRAWHLPGIPEFGNVLTDSLTISGTSLAAQAPAYSDADQSRAAEWLVSWRPVLGKDGQTACLPKTSPCSSSKRTEGRGEAETQAEAERLRMLYQDIHLYPDELALAALPSGSFSTSMRFRAGDPLSLRGPSMDLE
ncbi:hypothetical protein APUTEX25_003335 [Auxenochlorella protothecoides]|uniref:Uncharacterized protein n=1 Tax=Auxenochlorella protothecoides TaxID=3075 RepID=A0A3M7KSL1_AUXPR|nr:hypothetical protein APUTEX25_003335 [Auxenochlorella protothecoides]|eukprot:RMZ53513.1 hypothetical protein APUTEX25_003335 [Auxenochlorella protothecoides]